MRAVRRWLTIETGDFTHSSMIRRFKNDGLRRFFEKGTSADVQPSVQARWLRRLGVLHAAAAPEQMDLPGYKFRTFDQFDPVQYAVHMIGPWWITFSFEGANAVDVDLARSD
jgi:toxin HigB-1